MGYTLTRMNDQINSQRDKEIAKATEFLVLAIKKSGRSSKPVVAHSARVGLFLNKLGYNKDIVVAGILHDLLEDSKISREEIEQNFGSKVANLVQANSFNKTITDKKKRYQQSFARCLKKGKDALVIKAADILDNSHYYHLVKDEKLSQWLLEKTRHFLKNSEKFIKDEEVWEELKKQYDQLIKSRMQRNTQS